MQTVLPREEAVEAIFSKIFESKEACGRLKDVFQEHLEEENISGDSAGHFAEVLFHAYKNGDVTALLLELCGRSMFDLLREAYLIPKKFHGKAGANPVLLTDVDGNLLQEKKVTAREYTKFKETYEIHQCAPRSKIYLADGKEPEGPLSRPCGDLRRHRPGHAGKGLGQGLRQHKTAAV